MNEKIAAIKEYLKHFPYDSSVKNNLFLYECADELGIELKDDYNYYPRMEYGWFVINQQIKVGNRYYLTNSATHYEQNGIDKIVIWSEPCGRLAFVNREYWYDIDHEWKDLMSILKSYNPLDYDEINNNYIYNIEHGKKLINDYDRIIKDFMQKVNSKIKKVQLANKRRELERLQKELDESVL